MSRVGRPPIQRELRRNKAIGLRLTAEEMAVVQRAAKRSKTQVSVWVRMIAVKAAENA